MRWMHPIIGELLPLPSHLQPQKVWRHLHSPAEAWTTIVGTDTSRLQSAARAWGCPDWRSEGDYPVFRRGCADRLREQHERHWASPYGSLLLAPATRCARSRWEDRWLLLAPHGVYSVVVPGHPSWVLTVYRPHARGLSVTSSEEDYVHFAEARWCRETGMNSSMLRAELERRATDPVGVWRLALAVGQSENASDGVIVALREEARRWLGGLTAEIKAAATPAPSSLLDALEVAVRDTDADVTGTLLELEDAVVVTAVLVGQGAGERLIETLGALLDWTPPGWAHLAAMASARLSEAPVAAIALWEKVDEALGAAVVRELPAAHRPAARLASSLVSPSWWRRWSEDLEVLGETAVTWLSAPEAGWAVAAGSLSRDSGPWAVVPPPSLIQRGARVFVVHADEPGGEDVTADLGIGQVLWQLDEPGDEIRVVIVEGVAVGTLAEAIEKATSGASIRLIVVEISRPR